MASITKRDFSFMGTSPRVLIKIRAARQAGGVEDGVMLTGFYQSIYQCSHFAAIHVEHRQRHVVVYWQLKTDHCIGVEWIWIMNKKIPHGVFATLVVGFFIAIIGLAMLVGYWRNGISKEEYLKHFQQINSPLYQHNRGEVPAYEPNR